MMFEDFYDEREKERRGKITALWVLVLFFVVIALVWRVVLFSTAPEQAGEGIMISLGDVAEAGGELSDDAGMVAPASEPEEVLVQEHEEAPAVVAVPKPVTKPAIKPKPEAKPVPNPAPVVTPGLFNRPASNPASTSQGTGTGEGRQGAADGSPDGSPAGSTGGNGFSLSGRNLQEALPKPAYTSNKSGRVIVDIIVDENGVVTRAVYRTQGSTTNDRDLISAAERAARQARFNVKEDAGEQRGTITYNFNLR